MVAVSFPHQFAYIWYFESGQEEFYDLTIDPLELTNLARSGGPSLAPAAGRVLDELRSWVQANANPLPPKGNRPQDHYPGPVIDDDP